MTCAQPHSEDGRPPFERCRMWRVVECWSGSGTRYDAERCLEKAAEVAVAAIRLPIDLEVEREELVQNVMVRVWRSGGKAMSGVQPSCLYLTWLKAIARNCVHEGLRTRASTRQRRPQTRSLNFPSSDEVASRAPTPPQQAVLRETLDRVGAFAERLPPPCNDIAEQLALGRSHAEITDRLQAWRPVGADHCRRLIKRTKAMLRALEGGRDPGPVWPAGWDRKENPWFR